MSHHDIKLYNLLIVSLTQGILNAIEYLIFQIKYKKTCLKVFSKKRVHCQKTLGEGGGGGADIPSAPPAPEGLCFVAKSHRCHTRQILNYQSNDCWKSTTLNLGKDLNYQNAPV